MQTETNVDVLNEHTSLDGNHSKLKTVTNKIKKLSTEEVTALIQRLWSVSPKKKRNIYEMWNKEVFMKIPQCEKCGEIFQD